MYPEHTRKAVKADYQLGNCTNFHDHALLFLPAELCEGVATAVASCLELGDATHVVIFHDAREFGHRVLDIR